MGNSNAMYLLNAQIYNHLPPILFINKLNYKVHYTQLLDS